MIPIDSTQISCPEILERYGKHVILPQDEWRPHGSDLLKTILVEFNFWASETRNRGREKNFIYDW